LTADDEERLAALIDNELDEDEKSALLARLAQDEGLRNRLEALRQDRARLVASFDALLARAPLARLRAAIPTADDELPPHPKRASIGWLELAAGIVIGLLLAGAASWVGFGGFLGPPRETWRTAVIEYMDLYTPDTFALWNPDSSVQARQLQAVSAKVGVELTPEKVAVAGLRYRTAFNFSYDGDALAEIAYTDAGGAPVLFCVIANGKPDAPPRTVAREGLSYVTWSHGGRSYMFVGRMPEQRIAELALPLTTRF
jgi:anti-sigma factor RsiW